MPVLPESSQTTIAETHANCALLVFVCWHVNHARMEGCEASDLADRIPCGLATVFVMQMRRWWSSSVRQRRPSSGCGSDRHACASGVWPSTWTTKHLQYFCTTQLSWWGPAMPLMNLTSPRRMASLIGAFQHCSCEEAWDTIATNACRLLTCPLGSKALMEQNWSTSAMCLTCEPGRAYRACRFISSDIQH